MKTIILRHRRENLKKCSLRGLEKNPDFEFYSYPNDVMPDFSHYLLLKVDAPPLTIEDKDRGIFLIDATWRLAEVMAKNLPWKMEARSLPGGYKTAYPRKPNPETGLASIEALYLAHSILGKPVDTLFDNYRWKEEFLKQFV
jgi:pre-rRNA-processing protein TSR3